MWCSPDRRHRPVLIRIQYRQGRRTHTGLVTTVVQTFHSPTMGKDDVGIKSSLETCSDLNLIIVDSKASVQSHRVIRTHQI